MKIRALIVDDEALARSRIRKLLGEEADVEVAGECANGPEAIAFIREHRPDLVFLDVQMPEVSGFDVLRALPLEKLPPAVIFVTAHDQHAVEAFDVNALDYLLKPFTHARFAEAIRRARQQLQTVDSAAINEKLLEILKPAKAEPVYLSRIAVRNGNSTVFIKIEDVDYLESAANYVVLYTRAERHILRDTLINLEAHLPPRLFLRISRSMIVNLDRVKGVQSSARGDYLVILQDGRQLLMTRGLREVQDRLQYQ